MKKSIHIILTVILLIVLLAPYVLELVAKKHIMFWRYLVLKQHFFADSQFIVYSKFVAIALLITSILFLVVELKKRMIKNIFRCYSTTAVLASLSFLSVLNIDPLSTVRFYMLLISSIIFLCVSFIISTLGLVKKQ